MIAIRHGALLALAALATAPAGAATVHATLVSAFDTPIDAVAEVGPGIEFTGSNVFWDFSLDLYQGGFTLTVAKPSTAGNFTAVFDELVIDGIGREVTGVRFDAAGSSSFSSGDPDDIDLGTPGRIAIGFGGFASANSPATALSHSFNWEVRLGDPLPPVPEPASWALLAAGFAAVAWRTRRVAGRERDATDCGTHR